MSRIALFATIILLILLRIAPSFAASQPQTILLFGDSIIAGYGLSQEESIATRLQALLRKEGRQVNVINGGVSGDTTSGGRSRLEWTLKQYKPTLVFLALGGNDMLRGLKPAVSRANMDAMLATLKKYRIPVILSEVNAPLNLGVEYGKAFNSIYPEMAKKYDAALYPFLLKDLYGNATLMQSDGIHPNAKGARAIAEELAEYVGKGGGEFLP